MSGTAYRPGNLLVAILLAMTSNAIADAPASAARLPTAPVARILRWLPPDTEAIAVASGPLELKRSLHDVEGDPDTAEKMSLAEAGALFACSRVSQLQGGNLYQGLQGVKVDAIVDGRRRFHVEADAVIGHCDGCQILLAAEGEGPKLARAFEAWIAAGRSTIRVDDQSAVLVEEKVVVVEGKEEGELIRALFANPAPGVLLCASNPGSLREVLSRMRDETRPSAFPADRPEWRHVNCQAPFWGVRRFAPEGRDRDVTSPFHKRAAVADPRAIGFAFWCGAGNPKQIELVYLSNSRNAERLLTTESFRADDFRIDRIADDALRIRKVDGDDEEQLDFFGEILVMTGFLRAI